MSNFSSLVLLVVAIIASILMMMTTFTQAMSPYDAFEEAKAFHRAKGDVEFDFDEYNIWDEQNKIRPEMKGKHLNPGDTRKFQSHDGPIKRQKMMGGDFSPRNNKW